MKGREGMMGDLEEWCVILRMSGRENRVVVMLRIYVENAAECLIVLVTKDCVWSPGVWRHQTPPATGNPKRWEVCRAAGVGLASQHR